jgi:hypothetical protein
MLQLTNRRTTIDDMVQFGRQELADVVRGQRENRGVSLLTEPPTLDFSAIMVFTTGSSTGAWTIEESAIWNELSESMVPEVAVRVTQATTSTATTVSSLRQLLARKRHDERLQRMSPDRRSLYEEIRQLRERIGAIDFDVVAALRELRENG